MFDFCRAEQKAEADPQMETLTVGLSHCLVSCLVLSGCLPTEDKISEMRGTRTANVKAYLMSSEY